MSLLKHVLCSLTLSAALGCNDKIPEPGFAQPAAAPVPAQPVEAKPSQPPVQQAEPVPPPKPPKPKEGWSEQSLQDTLPLCLFGDVRAQERTQSMAQVGKQVLRADQPLVLGVFAPKCIHPDCDELSKLECSVERSGNILRLQTRYLGLHKDGSSCSEDCRDVRARCETPVLEPGEYTLEYGGSQTPLKIPSVQNWPCFKRGLGM